MKEVNVPNTRPLPGVINRFLTRYFFLGNYHPSPIMYDGVEYPSSEHAYQAAKYADIGTKKAIAAPCLRRSTG